MPSPALFARGPRQVALGPKAFWALGLLWHVQLAGKLGLTGGGKTGENWREN